LRGAISFGFGFKVLMAEYEVHSNGFWFLIGEDELNNLAWQRHTYKFGLEILVG